MFIITISKYYEHKEEPAEVKQIHEVETKERARIHLSIIESALQVAGWYTIDQHWADDYPDNPRYITSTNLDIHMLKSDEYGYMFINLKAEKKDGN